jgi:hypothetical protein
MPDWRKSGALLADLLKGRRILMLEKRKSDQLHPVRYDRAILEQSFARWASP